MITRDSLSLGFDTSMFALAVMFFLVWIFPNALAYYLHRKEYQQVSIKSIVFLLGSWIIAVLCCSVS
jgi:hypothetical protein